MPSSTFILDGQTLRIEDVVRVAREPRARVTLKPEARRALLESRRVVERAIESGQTIYGINTGFGKLANVRIPPDQPDQSDPEPCLGGGLTAAALSSAGRHAT
jgi:histidine ammonia-lyase